MSVRLRVHISPVGYEVKRVTEPLVKLQADRVYLITYQEDDNAKDFVEAVKLELKTKYSHIVVKEAYVDMWDPYACIAKFREIIELERANHVFVNVSTGTKVTAMAGMLACMLWDASPYYVKVSYPPSQKKIILPSERIDDVYSIPVYDINKPRDEYLAVLEIIRSAGGKLKKSKLIAALEKLKLIEKKDENTADFTQSAKHSQLRAILDPMDREWNYVAVESSGRRSEVVITEQGKKALAIFGVPSKYREGFYLSP